MFKHWARVSLLVWHFSSDPSLPMQRFFVFAWEPLGAGRMCYSMRSIAMKLNINKTKNYYIMHASSPSVRSGRAWVNDLLWALCGGKRRIAFDAYSCVVFAAVTAVGYRQLCSTMAVCVCKCFTQCARLRILFPAHESRPMCVCVLWVNRKSHLSRVFNCFWWRHLHSATNQSARCAQIGLHFHFIQLHKPIVYDER